ncbi:hypothetical protein GCM10011504_04290 [Siccirubricoccus deserti]|uniref:Uncharacterized protein n=1 Tax=Siccirubricoccus deserti TaxID=2013562 RepID=A0A9X0QU66_9PROT|nr:hypothetical protein [Siccirubricoccus deserti]MBC4013756.1 hypothetical protein [Siccirubricoccus deserti]GGC29211.1 hypothetical protein GCM10011504_04290 [Siccirubricoccus deserti]
MGQVLHGSATTTEAVRRAIRTIEYSMGAHVVVQLLTRQPERFLTAILGGVSGRCDWSAEDQRRVDVEAAETDEGVLCSQFLRLRPSGSPPPGG